MRPQNKFGTYLDAASPLSNLVLHADLFSPGGSHTKEKLDSFPVLLSVLESFAFHCLLFFFVFFLEHAHIQF